MYFGYELQFASSKNVCLCCVPINQKYRVHNAAIALNSVSSIFFGVSQGVKMIIIFLRIKPITFHFCTIFFLRFLSMRCILANNCTSYCTWSKTYPSQHFDLIQLFLLLHILNFFSCYFFVFQMRRCL